MKPCCHPRWISVPDFDSGNYLGTKKYRSIKVPCRHCVNCRWNYQREWILRLSLENELHDYSAFVTLTYSDDNLEPLSKKSLSNFVRLLRQKINRYCDKYGKKHVVLRYYACGEYGKKTNRQHYHLILFGLPIHNKVELHNLILSVWKKGFVYVEDVTIKNIAYISKYISKYDPRPHDVRPFRVNVLKTRNRRSLVYGQKD